MMFQPGELIRYGTTGVCRVDAVGPVKAKWADPQQLYYTLCPIYGNGTIISAVDSPVNSRPLISREDADALIQKMPDLIEGDEPETDSRHLAEYYRTSLHSGDCEDLVSLMHTIYQKRRQCVENGRKLHAVDDRAIKQAEDLLYQEFATVLEIPREEVPAYIEAHLPVAENA